MCIFTPLASALHLFGSDRACAPFRRVAMPPKKTIQKRDARNIRKLVAIGVPIRKVPLAIRLANATVDVSTATPPVRWFGVMLK